MDDSLRVKNSFFVDTDRLHCIEQKTEERPPSRSARVASQWVPGREHCVGYRQTRSPLKGY